MVVSIGRSSCLQHSVKSYTLFVNVLTTDQWEPDSMVCTVWQQPGVSFTLVLLKMVITSIVIKNRMCTLLNMSTFVAVKSGLFGSKYDWDPISNVKVRIRHTCLNLGSSRGNERNDSSYLKSTCTRTSIPTRKIKGFILLETRKKWRRRCLVIYMSCFGETKYSQDVSFSIISNME